MSQYKPQCIRSVANWTKVTKEHKFEKPTFNREQFLKDLPSFSPKLKELLDKIEELDAHDMKTENRTFKHFIFSDVKIGGTGAKIVASGLIAKGFNLAYDKKLKLASDEELLKTKKKNFILLASTSIYNGNISAGLKKQLLAKYNERPANVYGNLARIIVMDSGFKEGIDLFDVKYVHIFEPQTSKADQKQVIGRATRTCGQRGLVFHPTQGWPLKVFIYDVNIPKELRERFLHTDPDQTHIDSLFNLYMESTGIDLRKLTLADELEKVAIVGAVDYELNKPVHRFEIEDETEYGRLFDGGAQPISQPQPVDKPVNCQAKACGNIRANKHVPVSTALLTTVAISIGEKLPKIQKGESPRSFYCKLLKTNPDFCKRVQEANKDPVGYVQRNSDKILAGIKKKLYTGLRQSQKGAFLRLVFSVIPRPTIVKRMKKEDKAPSPVPETSPNTQSESLKSRSASPVARSVTPAVPASPTSSSSSNATQDSKSTSQSTESRSLSRSRSRSLSESMKESPQTPEQIMQELDKEMSYPRPSLVTTPDSRKNNFLKIRNHVRENFMEYAWPKVKLENLCGYGGENLPLNKESPQEGGAEIMNYTPTQAFVSEYFTPENPMKGMLLMHSVGTGKTCTGIATASKTFEQQGYTVLWVTRTTLKSDIWKNMFDQVCSESIKEKINKGQEIPATHSDRMRLLSKSWAIRPMSYKQFSNLVAGKNQLYQDLVKINGKEDPLRKTLLIIDEAHKLYGGEDLSSVERPDMKKLHQAIMKSYVTSGKDSVRVLLMTATPITNDAFELIKLLNLLRGPKEQLPEEYDAFSSNFLDTEGKFTKKGKFSFLNEIAGHISYLDRSKDARQFSQPQIQLVSTPMSTINESIYDEIEDAANIINDVNEQLVNMKTAKSTIKKKYSQLKKEEKGRCKGLKKEALSECRETSQETLQNLIKQEEDEVIESEAKLNSLKADKATNKSRIQKLKKEIKSDSSQLATIRLKCPKPKPRAKKTKAPTSS